MATPHVNFPSGIQAQALGRQKHKCAMCGGAIAGLGNQGRAQHKFGEGVQAHHVIPHSMGGPISVDNCVVICYACHMSAHQGGRWRDLSIYADVAALPLPQKIAKIAALYPHYNG